MHVIIKLAMENAEMGEIEMMLGWEKGGHDEMSNDKREIGKERIR